MAQRKLGLFILGLAAMALLFEGIHRMFEKAHVKMSETRVRMKYSPVPPGSGITTTGNDVPESKVTVAHDGVAHLPNGVTVSLKCIYSTATGPPAWDIAGRDVASGIPKRSGKYVSRYGDQTIDRSLWFYIDSPQETDASVMSYVSVPSKPDIFVDAAFHGAAAPHVKHIPAPTTPRGGSGGVGATIGGGDFRWRMGMMTPVTRIGHDSDRIEMIYIPKSVRVDKVTFRMGVGTGEWKSVLDFPNPLHGPVEDADKKASGGIFTIGSEPSYAVQAIPGCWFAGKSYNLPIPGDMSHVIPRRALLLDGNGYLVVDPIVSNTLTMSVAEMRGCAHIIVQERDMEWAEFRDIPLRPSVK